MSFPGPDTRVVELRVPGLIGTSPEALLDAVSTVDVAGDGFGRVIRPSDRLRRPAPGPMLRALGRAVPRTLEGYLWSRMTSGGASKATWALLFPFSLANVAYWMLPPVPQDKRGARVLGSLCRGLLRVAAVLLTMLLVSQLAVISLDLVATQCLSTGCVQWAPSWLRTSTQLRAAVGIVPLLAMIYILHRISSTNWRVHAEDTGGDGAFPGTVLRADPDTPSLLCVHTVVALACVALLPLGGPFHLPGDAFGIVLWLLSIALIFASLIASAMGRGAGRPGRWARGTLYAFGTLLVVAAGLRAPMPRGTGLAGADGIVEGIGAALVVVSVLFAVLLLPAAKYAKPAWRELPMRLRPWAGGWAAAPVLILAGLLGGGFGAGMTLSVRKILGADLRLPDTYLLITVLWGAGLTAGALLAAIGVAVAVPLRRRRRGIPDIVKLMEIGAKQEKEAAAAWARSAWERRHLHHLALSVSLLMAAGAVALLIVRFGLHAVPSWFEPVAGIGVFALGALAAGLLRVVYTAAKSPLRSRHLGALADLVCFWPRAAHPTVPPCYALKVIPELAGRAKEHLAEPNTRVVLSGYNLGSLLTIMTAARLAAELTPEEFERVGVLTVGSPLQWGYQRAFPGVLPHASLVKLYAKLDGRWRALCRGTDIFGGGVTTWRHQVVDGALLGDGYLTTGGVGPLSSVAEPESGVLIIGGDHWLPDPMRNPTGRHRWSPGVLKHADYLADAEWDHAVAMAAGLR